MAVAFQYSEVRYSPYSPGERESIRPAGMRDDDVYEHAVGDRVQLGIDDPQEEIVDRRCGGFGCVYILKSVEAGTRKLTAVKTPRSAVPKLRVSPQDFQREVELWLQLPRHPHVLPVIGVYLYNRKPYVRTPYVPPINEHGSSLADVLRNGALSFEFFSLFALQLINVLEFLQRANPSFCHGDIKPSNVLLEESPRILLTDFGLARAIRGEGSLVAGDGNYLSPEVFEGNASPGPESDMYAVGATLFEMLYGAPPHLYLGGKTRSTAWSGVSVACMLAARPDLPPEALGMVASCLARDADWRPRSFASLRSTFEAMVRDRGVALEHVEVRLPGDAELAGMSGDGRLEDHLAALLDPERARAIAERVLAASRLRAIEKFAEGERLLDEVLGEVPDLPTALHGKAHGYLLQGDRRLALEHYLRAYQVYERDEAMRAADNSGYVGTCVSAAQILVTLGDEQAFRLAHLMSQKGVVIAPRNPKAQMTYGIALTMLGEGKRGLEALELASRLDPSNRAIQQNLESARRRLDGKE